jgi:DNA-binding NtrC family response regulator
MAENFNILIVDDDPSIRNGLGILLSRSGYQISQADSGEEALSLLGREIFNLIITDFRLPAINGMELLRRIKEHSPQTEVIMITAYGEIPMVVEAMKQGAYDYLTKPFNNDELLLKVKKVSEKNRLQEEVKNLKRQIKRDRSQQKIIGNSPEILRVINLANQVAGTSSTVLIYGETGSGKDLIAQAIHYNSPRSEAPFMPINCAALPEQLIESELFGYVKGAFTGALQNKRGFFEEAAGGTLFLNEISEIPLRVQAKLLQALENQEIRRLGQSKSIKVDVRILAATNIDLEDAVRKGSFRKDLFYRLKVFPIVVPPLRERKEDIPLLVRYFLDKFCPPMNKKITTISEEAMEILGQYSYPGNVRELENIIQRSVIMGQGSTLLPHYLPPEIRKTSSYSEAESLAEMERKMIETTIRKCGGNLRKTSQRLGISRTTLWRKIKKFDIDTASRVTK